MRVLARTTEVQGIRIFAYGAVGQAQAWAATFRRLLTANSEAIHSGPADRGGEPPGGAP